MFSDNLGFNPFDQSNHTDRGTALRQKFLNSFKQNHIFVYNGNPRKKISSMNHTTDLDEALHANNNKGSDVYFYVNGGRKIYAIKQFTCCFCDMDAGRDDQGKYFKPSVVMNKKKQFLKKINEFPVKPSWVIDTRNGYQCYWIFDDASRKMIGANKTFWSGLQKKLVNYFGGDPRAIKPNQIYRVPYTWWRKGWEKKAPYFTSILPGSDGTPINVVDLKSALTGHSANIQIIAEKCSDEWYKGYAKAYKQADENGVPVSADVASEILNNMRNCNNKNTLVSKVQGILGSLCGHQHHNEAYETDLLNNLRETAKDRGSCVPSNDIDQDDEDFLNDASDSTYGDAMPVVPYNPHQNAQDSQGDEDINLDGQQTKLLKTVVEFLNQVSTPLYFSNNRFLSSAAKDLANQLSDKFCIG